MKCVDCHRAISVHKIVQLPNGASSLRKYPGNKRTRCTKCQKAYRTKENREARWRAKMLVRSC